MTPAGPENDIVASPVRARIVLSAAAAAMVFFVAVTLSPLASGFADKPSRGPSDIDLYWAEIGQIRSGQSYYAAAETELKQRGYPTHSVFNWRLPLPVWAIGKLPQPDAAKLLLVLLAFAVVALGFHVTAERTGDVRQAALCGLLLAAALLPCALDRLYVLHELWAGALIALSVLCYGSGKTKTAVAAGWAALAIRELAAPYCALCFLSAVKNRAWREAAFWAAGGAAYLAWFAWHTGNVRPRLGGATDVLTYASDWIRFGGAGFVISTVQMNGILLIVPQWITAVYLALALLGFASMASSEDHRAALTACLYLTVFAVVGQPQNQYWGSLIAPLMAIGVARAPSALTLLIATATSQAHQVPVAATEN